ncbi:hypothetical protein HK099_006324 [Clydaea vesicula]|uniref:Uncharacterized protein n=1 Tax=Clydaea vesicula TaxID=447962 RepID=A0AAD5XZ55_9FUNG|nr:hypothetical protein HK099_006324 [Clydaea vesicula]
MEENGRKKKRFQGSRRSQRPTILPIELLSPHSPSNSYIAKSKHILYSQSESESESLVDSRDPTKRKYLSLNRELTSEPVVFNQSKSAKSVFRWNTPANNKKVLKNKPDDEDFVYGKFKDSESTTDSFKPSNFPGTTYLQVPTSSSYLVNGNAVPSNSIFESSTDSSSNRSSNYKSVLHPRLKKSQDFKIPRSNRRNKYDNSKSVSINNSWNESEVNTSLEEPFQNEVSPTSFLYPNIGKSHFKHHPNNRQSKNFNDFSAQTFLNENEVENERTSLLKNPPRKSTRNLNLYVMIILLISLFIFIPVTFNCVHSLQEISILRVNFVHGTPDYYEFELGLSAKNPNIVNINIHDIDLDVMVSVAESTKSISGHDEELLGHVSKFQNQKSLLFYPKMVTNSTAIILIKDPSNTVGRL